MKSKKGLSTIVATLIIILLVMVSISIIWMVVQKMLDTGSKDIDYASKCTLIDLSVTAASGCNSTVACTPTVYRAVGGDEEGVYYKLIVVNKTNGEIASMESTAEIKTLATKSDVTFTVSTLSKISTASKVQIYPQFKMTDGKTYTCSNLQEYTIS